MDTGKFKKHEAKQSIFKKLINVLNDDEVDAIE